MLTLIKTSSSPDKIQERERNNNTGRRILLEARQFPRSVHRIAITRRSRNLENCSYQASFWHCKQRLIDRYYQRIAPGMLITGGNRSIQPPLFTTAVAA